MSIRDDDLVRMTAGEGIDKGHRVAIAYRDICDALSKVAPEQTLLVLANVLAYGISHVPDDKRETMLDDFLDLLRRCLEENSVPGARRQTLQ